MQENRPGGASPVAIAASQYPVQLRAGLIDDERTPSGMVCMATWRDDKLVARCVLPPETWEQIDDFGLLEDPVQVVLLAREAPPGLQCQLFAIVPLPEELEDDAFYHADLIGLEVVDAEGNTYGRVTAVFDFGGGDLIELSGGGRKQMLIPFTQGAVPEIDIDGGRIVIDPVAAGLVSDDDDDEGPGDEDGRP